MIKQALSTVAVLAALGMASQALAAAPVAPQKGTLVERFQAMDRQPMGSDPIGIYHRATAEWNLGKQERALLWLTFARFRMSMWAFEYGEPARDIMRTLETSELLKTQEIEEWGQNHPESYIHVLRFGADWLAQLPWAESNVELEGAKKIARTAEDRKAFVDQFIAAMRAVAAMGERDLEKAAASIDP